MAERRAELMRLVREAHARMEAMTPEERRRAEEHARTDPSPLGIRRRALMELIKNALRMAEQSAGLVREAGIPMGDTEPLPADPPAARADDVEEF